jgi:two-component system osmolarity sensor histidine kinase EnvZ
MMRFKHFLPRSIFGRSLMIVLTPMIILQMVMAVVFYERHWETVTRRLTNAVAGDVSTLIWMMNSYNATDDRSLVFRIGRMHLDLEAYLHPGEKLPDPLPPVASARVDRLLAQALQQRVGRPFIIDTNVGDRMVLIRVGLRDGVLDVYVHEERLFSSTTGIFVFWMIGTSVVLALIAAYFVRQQIRPIRRLAAAADSFGKGSVDVEFKPSGASEVRMAAHAFLLMRERILRQIEQRTQMLAGVSHDLRTPLTRMRLQLAMLSDEEEAESLKADIEEMEHMIDVYLAFARGEGQEAPRETDLSELLAEVAGNAPQDIAQDIAPGLVLKVRANALKRCLTNLIDNACRHGDKVKLIAARSPGHVVITVDDNGPGIPQDKREEALRAFVQLKPQEEEDDSGGSGLGLTIARDIVRSHGGDLRLESAPDGGLRARITLPV